MKRSGLIATKLGASSYYDQSGSSTNVTILRIEDCIVSAIKTSEKHGYNAVQLSSIDTNKDIKKINKSQRKIFSSINITLSSLSFDERVDLRASFFSFLFKLKE